MSDIKINKESYKTTYEGSYDGICFELEVFDGNYQIVWLETPNFESVHDIEQEIFNKFFE